ncbi:hypothetical protein [Polyangium sp. y55x31]|uniref:hypothetical protein n=1 Tax=Polyangium sp. y55x31 TaxID=3042688 RepID=UPI0024827F76|nr:hypothetical protein [Polyangium sp. y55x31]MDI1479350.1 hypothetical protein [Polyangium sp. y55x31]
MKDSMKLACTAALVTAGVVSPVIAHAATTPAAPPASPSYSADSSPIVLPVRPVPKDPFGQTLQETCKKLSDVNSAALTSAAKRAPASFDDDVKGAARAAQAAEQARTALAEKEADKKKREEALEGLQKTLKDKEDAVTKASVGNARKQAEKERDEAKKAYDEAKKAYDEAKPKLDASIGQKTRARDAAEKTLADAMDLLVAHLANLAQTCAVLADSKRWQNLTEEQLTLLRALHASNVFPSLADAIDKSSLALASTSDELVEKLVPEMKSVVIGAFASGVGGASALAGFGNRFVEGLAEFVVTRAKQEAILFLQERMSKSLCKDDGGRALPGQTLLANTCDALLTLNGKMPLHSMGTYLNAATRKDLVALPDSFLHVTTDLDPAHHYIYEPGRLVYAVARMTAEGGPHPLDVLSSVHQIPLRKCEIDTGTTDAGRWCKNIFRSVRVGSSFVHAIRQEEEPKRLITGPDAEAGPRLITLALNFESHAGIVLTADKLGKALTAFRAAAEATIAVDEAIENLNKGKKDDDTTAERRRRIAQATLQGTLAMIQAAQTLAGVAGAPSDGKVMEVLNLLQVVGQLGQDSLSEDYGALAVDLARLVKTMQALLPKKGEPGFDKVERVTKLLDAVGQYMPFIVEIAAAKSSQDVAAAFEAAAAPVGSYKVKFDRPTVALNAFFGAYGGGEVLLTEKADGVLLGAGAFAPVGLHLSKSFCESGAAPLGLMISVLDLGALTQQRLLQDVNPDGDAAGSGSAAQSPTVSWEQFISPGLYGTVGVGTRQSPTPFTFGLGVSFVPNFRKVEVTTDGSTSGPFDAPVLRFGVFAALDLTLLPLN